MMHPPDVPTCKRWHAALLLAHTPKAKARQSSKLLHVYKCPKNFSAHKVAFPILVGYSATVRASRQGYAERKSRSRNHTPKSPLLCPHRRSGGARQRYRQRLFEN